MARCKAVIGKYRSLKSWYTVHLFSNAMFEEITERKGDLCFSAEKWIRISKPGCGLVFSNINDSKLIKKVNHFRFNWGLVKESTERLIVFYRSKL